MTQPRAGHAKSSRRRRRMGNALFLPSQVPGMLAWYRADTLELADGTRMSSWPDASGNGKHMVQATGAQQPEYKTAIVNGKPVVRFGPTDTWMDCTALALTQPYTLAFVVKGNATNNRYYWDGESQNKGLVAIGDATNHWMYAGGGPLAAGAGLPLTFMIVFCQFNGVSSRIAHNLGTSATGTAGVGNTTGARVGGGYSVGDLNGDMAEVAAYSGMLTSAQINSIGRGLATKYGLAWTAVA